MRTPERMSRFAINYALQTMQALLLQTAEEKGGRGMAEAGLRVVSELAVRHGIVLHRRPLRRSGLADRLSTLFHAADDELGYHNVGTPSENAKLGRLREALDQLAMYYAKLAQRLEAEENAAAMDADTEEVTTNAEE